MNRTQTRILAGTGLLAFLLALALQFRPADTAPQSASGPPARRAAARAVPPPAEPEGPPPEVTSPVTPEAIAAVPAGVDLTQFDDSRYPEPVDELLVIEPGDPRRELTAAERAEDRARRQRLNRASLDAAILQGDQRVQDLGRLGAFAGEGNAEAAAELRRILRSSDPALRGDALEAMSMLLPGNAAVPDFGAEPLSQEQVDRLIGALRERDAP